ncbi:Myotubularin-related protein 2 [Wickerhamomyces ciferrii]|uniref:Myotubularin-related protein 2 n=1 Tax=Wickerhamomyces ciferrii (strain ATCC 14091 / BCRC 22168 / CBS 111 / JCM 3599 / NBRC 0793 / NRRL Y-1031 F-60-10) TaxID=1206466 RepID=K0KB78_WICCF|nr:Myotubularin-related protein 2 [Wickerhamomyces ciferrii]CCH42255.1 Myotubularin-related protein 2 [Wickerhamomyces ciferrii]
MISSVEKKKGSALLSLIDSNYLDNINNDYLNKDEFENKIIKNLPKLFNNQGKELNLFKISTLKLNCKDFNYLSFDFENELNCIDVFESIIKLTCLSDINQLYAFIYQPNLIESKFNSWNLYDPIKEFKRQGLKFDHNNNHDEESFTNWRISQINSNYSFSPTYPNTIIIPKTISDSVLIHASKYRSKQRIPALTYYYKKNGCSITRCSQPLLGLKQTRSIQDEKLIDEIFKASLSQDSSSKMRKNLIIDARPTTNAMAQTALGAGSENMDNYPNCEKLYLGIDNIHVMRDSLNKLIEILKNGDLNKPSPKPTHKINKLILQKTQWLKYISILLSSTEKLVKSIVLNDSNILIHCSDGWDRTSQISSLIQICIDPYYRTLQGFITLVEKDWISFGHRFNERSGHLSSESIFHDDSPNSMNNQASIAFKSVSNHFKKRKHLKLTSPIFHQFLDSIYQILVQFPEKFEFNERFLRRLIYHLYSCQYGNFLFDNEMERVQFQLDSKTRSVWDYFLSRKREFLNPNYIKPTDEYDWISPNYKNLIWWWQLYGKSDEEMNGDIIEKDEDNGVELKDGLTNSIIPLKEDNNKDSTEKTKDEEGNSKIFALTSPPPSIYQMNTNYNDNEHNDKDIDRSIKTIEEMSIT